MDFEAAGVLYEAAILSSKRHKFLSEEALANELAGYFYLDTGKKRNQYITSRKHFKSILNGVLLQKQMQPMLITKDRHQIYYTIHQFLSASAASDQQHVSCYGIGDPG
eukprot:scaffold4963_cov115-Skeletonema_dohrnii-CCMP3373.AAC.11